MHREAAQLASWASVCYQFFIPAQVSSRLAPLARSWLKGRSRRRPLSNSQSHAGERLLRQRPCPPGTWQSSTRARCSCWATLARPAQAVANGSPGCGLPRVNRSRAGLLSILSATTMSPILWRVHHHDAQLVSDSQRVTAVPGNA